MARDKTVIDDAREVLGKLKDVTPILERWAATPPAEAHSAAAPPTTSVASPSAVDAYERVLELRGNLIKMPEQTLLRMIGLQMRKGAAEGQGIPLAQWLGNNGAIAQAMGADPILSKALDTAAGSALIRQDLEPLLYAAFVRRFPIWDRMNKIPSNGLVHAYSRHDSAPDASFISELGTVPSGQGVYTRATTNIAIAAISVGVGLKNQIAAAQTGGWNPETQEINGGLLGMRRKLQRTLLSGNATVPGKVATDPEGLFDINSFDGLRGMVPAANIDQHDASARTIAESLNIVDGKLSVTGGQCSIIMMDARDAITWQNELQASVRYILPNIEVVPGLPSVKGITLGHSGDVPVITVPGDEVGHYTDGVDVRDAFLLDESVIDMPYLGSEMPTILDIPVGVSGNLTHTFIMFQMIGLAVRVPNFQAKLQLPQ